ncbi:hypothetical protein E4T50_02978 [Aureobasidium sp. EXF-12298]|nr:hypothetical protein E4T50_02978 [Aureobasidium sp. EXF-12298]
MLRIGGHKVGELAGAQITHAIDAKVFSSILDLDDNEDQNFSWSLVFDFIELAKQTLDEMDACLSREQNDFKQLRDKATFLRGPFTTLGAYRMEGTCARIQQLVVEGTRATLDTAASLIQEARERFLVAEKALHQLY